MKKIKTIKTIVFLIILAGFIGLTGCEKDKLISILTTSEITGDYSGDGTLSYSYHADGESGWSTVPPAGLEQGSKIWIRITNGTNDLGPDKFLFNWKTTSGVIANPNADVAELTLSDSAVTISAEVTEIMELVLIKRSNGRIYTVNQSNGDTLFTGVVVKSGGAPLTGLRALEYDPASGKCFIGSTNDDNGRFYSLNITTGDAAILNENTNQTSRYGISGLLMAPDGNVIVSMKSAVLDNSAIAIFDKNSGDEGTHKALTNGSTMGISHGGLIYGSGNSQLIIGGENEIYFSDLSALISDTTVLLPSANISSGMYVMDLAKKRYTGEVYGLINDFENGESLYLTKIDVSSGIITEIKKMAGVKSNWVHCLEFIPKHRLY